MTGNLVNELLFKSSCNSFWDNVYGIVTSSGQVNTWIPRLQWILLLVTFLCVCFLVSPLCPVPVAVSPLHQVTG